MRIAFTGSGGTGKTTLLEELNKELELPVIGEGIREWLVENDYKDFKDLGIEGTIKMQEDTLQRKMSIESELQSFVADRTTVDNLCYAVRWIGSVNSEYDTWMAQYITHAINHANVNYDIIFMLPWGVIPIEKDGTRSSKTWYQYMMQNLIERHIYMLERPYVYEVMQDSLEDRTRECLKIIRSVDLSVLT